MTDLFKNSFEKTQACDKKIYEVELESYSVTIVSQFDLHL